MAMETHPPGGKEQSPRPPDITDVASLCDALNRAGAKYVVVGGFAIIQAGFPRFTEDLDLLVETSPANEATVLGVLAKLPDAAAAELTPGEIARYGVVRVADEILVDLMQSGCGVTYDDAIHDAVWREVLGVRIPFASKATLWKMKQTVREKDIPDRLFLIRALADDGIELDPPLAHATGHDNAVPAWLQKILNRLFAKRGL
jgi:hypothetical protein